MSRCLIDTDVMIDVSRGNPAAAGYVDSLDDIAISSITANELIVGARDKRDLEAIDNLVSQYPIVHLDAETDGLSYHLLKRYAKSNGLRSFDALIASTALNQSSSLSPRTASISR
jgi:predicted nucleic acid-binding protein